MHHPYLYSDDNLDEYCIKLKALQLIVIPNCEQKRFIVYAFLNSIFNSYVVNTFWTCSLLKCSLLRAHPDDVSIAQDTLFIRKTIAA